MEFEIMLVAQSGDGIDVVFAVGPANRIGRDSDEHHPRLAATPQRLLVDIAMGSFLQCWQIRCKMD
jgi:hypothetical protein